MINTFYKDYLKKFIAILLLINFALSIIKLIAKPTAKSLNFAKTKSGQLAKTFVKQTREV